MAKWILNKNDANIDLMNKILKTSSITSYVLANRNIRTKNTAIKYLNPSLDFLEPMEEMKDVKKAIEIIEDSKKNNEKIVVYGDYDADGVTSVSILVKALKNFGCDVSYYIPNRESEGYGLNIKAVKDLKENETDLLITCDNGISSLEEIKIAKQLGMKVIVIDHHEAGFLETENGRIDVLPKADAIINPKQQSCNYSFKEMCAAGISYKFVRELYRVNNLSFDINKELIIFATIGTFCDVVDLQGENRIIAKNGLELMNKGEIKNLGLKCLLNEKEIFNKKLGSFDIGFIIGPCINASGRLESATIAVELFLTEDEERGKYLAKTLSDLNEERKKMTNVAVENALENLKKNSDIKPVIIVYDENIHESVAGIVAGKIKDTFFHPTIVLTKGENFVKGSARSIEAYNIFESLYENRNLFENFGGHAMAAGLSMKKENINILERNLNENCKLSQEDFVEVIKIDKELILDEINLSLGNELEIMEPFGKGNKEPLFLSRNILIEEIRVIEDKNTIIFTFGIKNSYQKIKAICFGKVLKFQEDLSNLYDDYTCDKIMSGVLKNIKINLDIVYSININEFRGNISVQLKIKDFKMF